jgi:AbrB family looped-hinge helix DNA binding protein
MEGDLGDRAPKFYGTAVIGERGQIVIPAEARRVAELTPGTKMVVLGAPHGKMLMLAKADSIAEMMASMMEHMSRLEKLVKLDDNIPDSGGE